MDLPFNKTGIVRPACKLTDSRSTDDYLKTLSLIPKSEMERLFSKAKLWGACEYFTVTKHIIQAQSSFFRDGDSFVCVCCTSGNGKIENKSIKAADSFIISAGYGEYEISCNLEF